jgi:hypothetical protein
MARALVGEVAVESLADDLEHSLRSLDIDDLGWGARSNPGDGPARLPEPCGEMRSAGAMGGP